jgi:tRNA(Ile)-lysidine synthase
MAHTRKPKSNNIIDSTKAVLSTYIKQDDHVIVALSGGIDSIVLLDMLNSLSKPLQFTLSAVHIDHGISQNAGQWCKFCCNLCRTLHIPIAITHLKIRKEPGISLEASARYARYQVFNHLLADYVVLGQHQDDQAETLLLQLLRGAGIRGLAAMPVARKQESDRAPQILRPMLDISRSSIQQYAEKKKLNWINDESNEDITFDRNFLRHEIFPLLKKRYPTYQKTLSRTSQHLAEASHLLDELAELDNSECRVGGKLQIVCLRKLSLPRAKNLLRYTLSQQGISQPSTKKMADILQQLLMVGADTKLLIPFENIEFRCYKGTVNILPRKVIPDNDLLFIWHGEERLILDQLNGSINFSYKKNSGIDPEKLNKNHVTIRLRYGGERFSPNCKRPRRRLKSLFQEALIPPWERNALPLLFSGEQLVWVPGIGIECEFQTTPGKTGLVPTWQPD